MQQASENYKKSMKDLLRNRSFMKVTIGMINQDAQRTAYIPEQQACTYFSNITLPFDNYEVENLYATCEKNYCQLSKPLVFLPPPGEEVIYNAGIVSETFLGAVEIRFPQPVDVKGLTIDFGHVFPVEFTLASDHDSYVVTKNDKSNFVTEQIFREATFIRIQPIQMSNGTGRLRIQKMIMGIGIYFDNKDIISASKTEFISPVMESLPASDFDLTIENKNKRFDIENDVSSIHFLEPGQRIEVLYGYEPEYQKEIEWIPGGVWYLKEWEADDTEMNFTATDRFVNLEGIYYRGNYNQAGISLYDLAEDVLLDAGIDNRDFWIDSYLQTIKVKNPMPPISYKEALQMIANAGRCVLYQDKKGVIILKSSFIPEMEASSDYAEEFSRPEAVLSAEQKHQYASGSQDGMKADGSTYFLPVQAPYLNTGYISSQLADSNGDFKENPSIQLKMESVYKCFGLSLDFAKNPPESMKISAYYNNELQESSTFHAFKKNTIINHEFPEFDVLVIEFIKGTPNNRVVLNQIRLGDVTDYMLEYRNDLLRTPKGIQLPGVSALQVVKTQYGLSADDTKEIVKEKVIVQKNGDRFQLYFKDPSYQLGCNVNAAGNITVAIVESSAFYAVVEVSGITVKQEAEIVITGKQYTAARSYMERQIRRTGSLEVWENPLVESDEMAENLAEWIGDYLASDREYELEYRGEPRIEANDLLYLEAYQTKKNPLIRVYEHSLAFDEGVLSGEIKARRSIDGMG